MLISNIKYSDSSNVLKGIQDDDGNFISIYEQKDIGEFFSIIVDRL